jgi:type VI secretion system secreted protein VgrG
MADPISQNNRVMSVTTPLGEDVLCIDRAAITERISKPFTMQLEFLTDVANVSKVKHDELIGKAVTLNVELPGKPGEKKRSFNGMVSRFSAGGRDARFAYYRAEVVPWLWLLTLTSDCKVWQFKTIPEIIEDVFKEWQGKFSDLVKFENKLTGDYLKVDYCVQYRETDFNFVSRLMEQEGICYFFKHDENGHTLVLGDDPSAFEACPHLEKARYLPDAGMGEWEDGVTSWESRHSMVPGMYRLADYHFQRSNDKFHIPATGAVTIGNNAELEVFDFPGEFAQRFNKPDERLSGSEVEQHAAQIAKWRMEEQAAAHLQISGGSTCRAFTTGTHFELLGQDEKSIKVPGTEGKYVLASCKHTIEQSPDYVSNGAVQQPYRNSFTCFSKETPYRPARTSPRPVIQGVQSAVVVGLKDEEIDCDKYGRVKVQFHWDRKGEKNEKSSCWVRVATPLAGNKWGMIHIPRIGQEVIVSFLEGDPDQPLIVGSVYNLQNMPPYKLDENKTQSGIKTRSTLEGDEKNFNEISFEDKKGEELLYIRAEKNLTKAVENDEWVWVGNDRWEEVDNNEEITVDKGNRTVTLKQGNDKHQLKMGNREVLLDMGNDALTIKMGNQTTKLDLGKSETEAMQSIELKVGQSSFKIDQTGITIKGMMVKVEGTIMTEVKGLMTTVKADAMLTAQGAITMIN